MERGELPVVDVSVDSASLSWHLLLRAVQKADFIALDLELSGLGGKKTQGVVPLEERYKIMCGIADSYAILSVGVACFRWAELDHAPSQLSLQVEVFNMWLMCQKPYTTDPSSVRFLREHGFDFNKQFDKGLPYTPGPYEPGSGLSPSPQLLLAHILLRGKPVVLHNGWTDLLFLYHTFYTPLPQSLPSFMADLTEMFRGGVYDTKAIAQYEVKEKATFLEYVFRKSQRENAQRQFEGSPHLKLLFAGYTGEPWVEMVSLAPPTTTPTNTAVQVQTCPTFAQQGFCHRVGCGRSHDVMVVLEQEEHWHEVHRLKRKRRRARRQQTRSTGDPDPVSAEGSEGRGSQLAGDLLPDCSRTEQQDWMPETKRKRKGQLKVADEDSRTSQPEDGGEEEGDGSVLELFQKDLESARARLGSTTMTQRPSFGHRAGFDAFMTGYSFAFYALKLTNWKELGSQTVCSSEALLAGLSSMYNCLANRRSSVPNRIAKSHFAKPSAAHQQAWERMERALGTTS